MNSGKLLAVFICKLSEHTLVNMHLPEALEALEDHCHPFGQQVPVRKRKGQDINRTRQFIRCH
jgi:hypothetical protein